MKNFAKILLVMICLVIIHNSLFSQAPTNGLVAYYPFNGGAADASGNGRNGVISGGISLTSDRSGNSNQAYAFNGSNSAITVSNWGILTGNAARTMSAWFKGPVTTGYTMMLSWGSISANLSSSIGTGIQPLYIGFVSVTTYAVGIANPEQYYDNRWHLMTFTHNGSVSTLYLDGIFQTSTSNITLNTSSSNLVIGSYSPAGGYFNGAIDDVRVYNRALSATEVQQLYIAEAINSTSTEVLKLGTDRFIHATGIDNTFLGLRSGAFSSGSGSTFVGKNTGSNNIGSYNSFFGLNAGKLNTTGESNLFIGQRAGDLNVSGSNNVYVGNESNGYGNNSSSIQRSVAIGYKAKVSINDAIILGDTANTNLKVGIGTTNPSKRLEVRAANANESGIRITNLLSTSPTSNRNGKVLTVSSLGDIILVPDGGSGTNTHSDSVFVGTISNTNFTGGNLGIGVTSPQFKLDVNGDINMSAGRVFKIGGNTFMKAQSTSPFNTNIGFNSGSVLTTGSANTCLGFSSGYETTTGNSNTFIGTQAGYSNSSGLQNTFIGLNAGGLIFINNVPVKTNITGSYNVFIGAYSNPYGSNFNSLQRSGAVGYNARVSVNDALVFGDFESSNFKVGIGLHDPQFKLDVKGPINIRGINGGLGELKFMTYNFLQGDQNFNSGIGFLAEVDSQYVHSTAIGYKSFASANNVLVLGGINENAVNVGIGNSAPQSSLEITSKNEGESGLMFTNLTQNFTAKHSNSKFLSVDEKGKVGLYNLSADQITLKLNNANQWSDKVFASNYPLMPINKVEDFIKTKKHLPNIPTAEEMTEKGISTQEMFAKLLEKNEELMLYLLEQNKINSQQAKEIEELKKEIQKMKK